jgi:glycosyltransferase 2 family protein
MSHIHSDAPQPHPFRPFHIPKSDIRWLRHLVPLVVVGLAVHLLLPQIADLQKSWQVLEKMPWWLLGLAALMQVGSYVGSGLLLQGLVRLEENHLSLWRSIAITLASGSIGLVAGGIVGSSAATYDWIRTSGVSSQGAGLASMLRSVFNNGLLLLLSIIGLSYLIMDHDVNSIQVVGFSVILIILVLISGVLIWGATHPERLTRWLKKHMHRWVAWRGKAADPIVVERNVNQLHNTWIVLRSNGWQFPLLGAALNIAFDSLTIYVLFFAAGQPIGLGVLLTGYGLPLLLGKAVFLPGGVGIVESTMTAIYTSHGISSEIVVVVILGYRLLSFWIPALFGFPLAAYLQRTSHTTSG